MLSTSAPSWNLSAEMPTTLDPERLPVATTCNAEVSVAVTMCVPCAKISLPSIASPVTCGCTQSKKSGRRCFVYRFQVFQVMEFSLILSNRICACCIFILYLYATNLALWLQDFTKLTYLLTW